MESYAVPLSQVVHLPAADMALSRRQDSQAAAMTGRPRRRAALLPALALLAVAAFGTASLFVSPSHNDGLRSTLIARSAEGEAKPKKLVFQPAPVEEQPGNQPGGPSSEENPESGKRLRQFLALEALDDAPAEGNQWDADMKDEQLTSEEQRKKTTAIVTIVISLGIGFLYLAGVWFMENREFSSETALSADDIARLSA